MVRDESGGTGWETGTGVGDRGLGRASESGGTGWESGTGVVDCGLGRA